MMLEFHEKNPGFEAVDDGRWSAETSDNTDPKIEFESNGFLTVGVEVEFQVMDQNTYNLSPAGPHLVEKLAIPDKIKPEFYLSSIEINTGICQDANEVYTDLSRSFDAVEQAAHALGLCLSTTGCHPFSRYSECVITPSTRYEELIDRNQWLTRRMTVYGLHVHLGMRSGDECIRYNNFFMHFLPHLLALSASSPFWQGDDTGLASCRPTTYEAMPTAGLPYQVGNWREFEHLCYTLRWCKSISSLKDLWWDMRPSPNFGTLEIRTCDGPATLSETNAIVAYIHALSHWFDRNGDWLNRVPPPPRWIGRENKWRVMRYGLDAELVSGMEGETKPIRDLISQWMERTFSVASELGYHKYYEVLERILRDGNSASRQRAKYLEGGSITDVAAFNVAEFKARSPKWQN